MKKFFYTLRRSVYDPEFYREADGHNVSTVLGYFSKLISFIAVVGVVIPAIVALALFLGHRKGIDAMMEQVKGLYPAGLEVTIRNGHVSTNVSEPYAIELPKAWQYRESHDDRAIKNLLVIDTEKPIEMSDFRAHETLIILGEKEVGFYDSDQAKVEIRDLSEFADENYTLDQDMYVWIVSKAWKWAKVVIVVLVVTAPFFITVALLVWYVIYLLLGALVIWLAAVLRKREMTYGRAYKLGFYLLTLPILASFLLKPIFQLPFFFTLALFAIAYANFKSDDANGATLSNTSGSVPKTPSVGSSDTSAPVSPVETISLPAEHEDTSATEATRDAVLVGDSAEKK